MHDLESRFGSLARVRPPDLWDEIANREPRSAPRPPPRSRFAAAALALAIGIAGVFGVVVSFQGVERPVDGTAPGHATPPGFRQSRAELPEPSGRLTLAAETKIVPAGFVSSLIFGESSIWASSTFDKEGNRIHRLTPDTLDEIASIPVDGSIGWETGGGGLAFQGTALWAFGDGRLEGERYGPILERIDTSTNRVAETISIPADPRSHAADIAIDDAGIWLTLTTGGETGAEVVRLDPTSHEIVARIPLQSGYARELVATESAVLVQERIWKGGDVLAASVLDAIDPASNSVVARVTAYEQNISLAQPVVWRDQVWAGSTSTQSGLVRIDPGTAAPAELIELAGTNCCGTTLGPGGIWFTGERSDGRFVGIFDPSRSEVSAMYEAPRDAAGVDTTASADGIFFLDYDGFVRRYALG